MVVQETLPTGKYDRLSGSSNSGLGSGAYTTMLGVYSQTYLWLPNSRILRVRFNASQAFSSTVKLEGMSVYGTGAEFRGRARPGASTFVDAAAEYSLTPRWALALDVTYRYNNNTRVTGYDTANPTPAGIPMDSGSGYAVGLAPAIEYNWRHNLGVIVGTYAIVAGRSTAATITPVVAINFFH
ncbi:MAG: transporter [Chlamydiota bacterium]